MLHTYPMLYILLIAIFTKVTFYFLYLILPIFLLVSYFVYFTECNLYELD